MISELLWIAVIIQIIMGGTDTLLHHEFTERLAWQPSAQKELKLHALRNWIYAGLFLTFAWGQPQGLYAMIAFAFIIGEVIITLWDFVEEDLSRKLPATERVLHTLLALNYGAILVLILPLLWNASGNPTAYESILTTSTYPYGTIVLTIASLGVALFGLRDYLAAIRLSTLPRGTATHLAKELRGKKHILITGATGFIGQRLTRALLANNHQLIILTRTPQKAAALGSPIKLITSLKEVNDDDPIDAVINLAGEPLANGYWTKNKRRKIISSRVNMAEQLYQLCERLYVPPKTIINASAIGWYGLRGDELLDEESLSEPCFTNEVCERLEAASTMFKRFKCRVVNMRIGLVLGTEGGMLANLLVPFEYGVGGPIGKGDQWMSWIDLDDLVRLIIHALANEEMEGPVNAVAPEPVKNSDFAKALGKALHRPASIPLPAFFLKLVMGDFAKELLLASQRVKSVKINPDKFSFNAPTIEEGLAKSLPIKKRKAGPEKADHKSITNILFGQNDLKS